MAVIKAFKGIRFNLEKKDINIEQIVTQPYDKITVEGIKSYYQKSPYNVIRLILGSDDDFYQRSKNYIEKWLSEKVLIQDEKEAIYPYFQTFTLESGKSFTRYGLCAAIKTEPYDKKVVFPHEKTLSGPKKDRRQLLETTQMHLGQIFFIYQDIEQKINNTLKEAIASKIPLMSVHDEYGVLHQVWKIDEIQVIADIQDLMKEKQIIIADGHHRYETALQYGIDCGSQNEKSKYVLATLVNAHDPGLVVLPTHRLVHSLKAYNLNVLLDKCNQYFNIKKAGSFDETSLNKLEEAYATVKKQKGNFILADSSGKIYLLVPKDINHLYDGLKDIHESLSSLDVKILHELILQKFLNISLEDQEKKLNLSYFRMIKRAGHKLLSDPNNNVLFLLNASEINSIFEVARAGEVMPQKSTDFYPKLLTGLIFYSVVR